MKKTVIYIILSGWMLAGCGTYSRYHRPDLSTENLYRDMPADIDTMTIASLSWREMFTDPKLQSLIETGLERNADLNVARLRVEAAEAVLMTARLSYLPSLGLTYDGDKLNHFRITSPKWIFHICSLLCNNGAFGSVLQRCANSSFSGEN